MSTHIRTYTGRLIDPLDPDPSLIVLEDIAHALANVCRFTGHTKEFYSVAQHSVHVSDSVSLELALWGLLHDASEAYLCDMARPVKHGLGLGEVYRAVEKKLQTAIYEKFGLHGEQPHAVHWADDMLLRTEQRDLMRGSDYDPDGDFWPQKIKGWSPEMAKGTFLDTFRDLTHAY